MARKGDEEAAAPRSKRLSEIAKEASERLDRVLGGDDGPRAVEETADATGRSPAGARRRPGGEASGGPGVEKRAASSHSGADRRADRRPGAARNVETETPMSSGEDDRRLVLVCHSSPGIARMFANLLRDMDFVPIVVSTVEELDSSVPSASPEIVFLQGSPSPYPSMSLVNATLARYAGAEVPIVLLKWRDAPLIRTAGDVNFAKVLEWPFEPGKVRRELSTLMDPSPGGRSAAAR